MKKKKKKLSFRYQLRSINLKAKREESSAQGSPSQQTFTDKENTRISGTSSARSVCLRPKCLSLHRETQLLLELGFHIPPRAAFDQSFAYEPLSEVTLFSRNLPQKRGDFK